MPVGTEYHWYILAHQNTAKQTANDYTTSLTGLKFKIAHKRADTGKWSATPRTQRKRMIMFLRSVLADLEKQSDREGAVIAAREALAAGKRRARMSRAAQARKGRAAPCEACVSGPSDARRHARARSRVNTGGCDRDLAPLLCAEAPTRLTFQANRG